MRATAAEIERVLEEIGVVAAVRDLGEELEVAGMVITEGEHRAALEVIAEMAPDKRLIDELEVVDVLPEQIGDLSLSEAAVGDFPAATPQTMDDEALEPGDFTDQEILENPYGAGPGYTAADEEISEGDEVWVPPTDPVRDREGEVLGGFETTSMDSVRVPKSALDGLPGDEAIADTIRRELREDAATTGLEYVTVAVQAGVVYLRGKVQSLDDAESAEEVAFRVEGVVDVYDELVVEDML